MIQKVTLKLLILPLLVSAVLYGCKAKQIPSKNQAVLLDKNGWKIDTLRKDIVWYQYTSAIEGEFAHQKVNVVSFNPDAKKGKAILAYHKEKDSLSAIADTFKGSIAGINATYFLEQKDTSNYMYLRLKSKEIQTVNVSKSSIYYWKHEGMFSFNNKGTSFKIGYSPENFSTVKAQNVITGAPMLIDNYKPVGLTFADTSGIDLKKLHYEHYLKHQGVRHPRTAIALTGEGSLLLITVDGRNENALGMSAKELTAFLKRFFNPQAAMNIDGGGSTTMWVKGEPFNGIVNYPTDNKKFDHYGQRKIETALLIE